MIGARSRERFSISSISCSDAAEPLAGEPLRTADRGVLAIGYRVLRERKSGAPAMRLALRLSRFGRLASFPARARRGFRPATARRPAGVLGKAALQHGHEIDDVIGRGNVASARFDRPALLLRADQFVERILIGIAEACRLPMTLEALQDGFGHLRH